MKSGDSKSVVLIGLPTFPKGIKTLQIPVVAGLFEKLNQGNVVKAVDLNFHERSSWRKVIEKLGHADIFAFGVSAQNFEYAKELSCWLKKHTPDSVVVWGGELPTFHGDACHAYADAIVSGPFAEVCDELWHELQTGLTKKTFGNVSISKSWREATPNFRYLKNYSYWRFIGHPIGFTYGCTYKCTFCMVHLVQPKQKTIPLDLIQLGLRAGSRSFLNVVDYNIGIDRDHLIRVSELLKGRKQIRGWMGELCLEALDAELVRHLGESRMKIAYCGLESSDQESLKSVNKRQNKTENYREIVKRAQDHGIEIAAGLIIGLGHSSMEGIKRTVDLYCDLGLIYMKVTFLTFNPGTKVHQSMQNVGNMIAERISEYDGMHVSFLFEGQDQNDLYKQAEYAIREFYSLKNAWRRSRHLRKHPRRMTFFLLFSYLYGLSYRQWIKFEILKRGAGRFEDMLTGKFKKGFLGSIADHLIKYFLLVLLFSLPLSGFSAQPIPAWSDPTLSREARVQVCASCHAAAYEAWQEGPHSLIYTHAKSKELFNDPGMREFCWKCHNPENLFEAHNPAEFTNQNKEFDALFRSLKPDFHKDFKTGIDCLTCHVSGTTVYAGPQFRADPNKTRKMQGNRDFCNPIPNQAIAAKSCIVCHVEGKQRVEAPRLNGKDGSANCMKCHSQPMNGDHAHYFAWARDFDDPARTAKRLATFSIFSQVKMDISGDQEAKKRVLSFTLKNNFAPHPVFMGGLKEYTFKISVPNRSRVYEVFKVLRIITGDRTIVPQFENLAQHPEEYFSLGGEGEGFRTTFEVPKNTSPTGDILLDIYYKRNLAMSDAEAIKVTTLRVPY